MLNQLQPSFKINIYFEESVEHTHTHTNKQTNKQTNTHTHTKVLKCILFITLEWQGNFFGFLFSLVE
jgi:hypothetical protein